MAVQLTIEVDRKVVICSFTGEISDADILSVRSLINSHPDFNADFSEILDFSSVTAANLSTPAIQLVSERPSNFKAASRHAVVAPQDFLFGLACMSQVFAESTRPNAAVVRSIAEARKVLGLADATKG
jgi:hypothetical protein